MLKINEDAVFFSYGKMNVLEEIKTYFNREYVLGRHFVNEQILLDMISS